ncbi:MAG: hypothetical protein KAR06_03610 [Deltaproteobacteria bacterium]|nr:hypothetical protein [Deltaproteobacteria bacterium]
MNNENTTEKRNKHKINCDQVAWLMDIFNRYLPQDNHPRVSQQREMLKYGMLYEIMDILYLDFEDDAALYNGMPSKVRENRL